MNQGCHHRAGLRSFVLKLLTITKDPLINDSFSITWGPKGLAHYWRLGNGVTIYISPDGEIAGLNILTNRLPAIFELPITGTFNVLDE